MHRRELLRRSIVAAGALGFPAVLRSASPNSMLQVACIGVGGMGGSTMMGVPGHPKVKIVWLCDVDDTNLRRAAKKFPDASRHNDWRELLGRHAKEFVQRGGHRFLEIHMLPARIAVTAGGRVHVIGRSDRHRIELLCMAAEQLSPVVVPRSVRELLAARRRFVSSTSQSATIFTLGWPATPIIVLPPIPPTPMQAT